MEKHKPELEFFTSPDEILRVLIHSKEFGNVVGVSSAVLGSGIFMTAVEKIILDYETVVQFKPVDVMGHALANSTLRLSEISLACGFRSRFERIVEHAPKEEPTQVGVYCY